MIRLTSHAGTREPTRPLLPWESQGVQTRAGAVRRIERAEKCRWWDQYGSQLDWGRVRGEGGSERARLTGPHVSGFGSSATSGSLTQQCPSSRRFIADTERLWFLHDATAASPNFGQPPRY